MACVRTCDRCGASAIVEMNKPGNVRAYAFDLYQPMHPMQNVGGMTTVADLCEKCADNIRREMITALPRAET